MTLRRRIYEILDCHDDGHPVGRAFAWFLFALILLNVGAVILVSFDDLARAWGPGFDAFETFSVAVFTVEYLLRLWTAPERYPGVRWARGRHLTSFFSLVDLVAVLPFYLPLLIPVDLRFLRVLRVIRLVRLFKLGRFLASFELVRRVLVRERDALAASFALLATLLLLASCLMYAVEHEAQPDRFSNVLATMWWAVVTLTTVGYGDLYPVTVLGKVLSGVISIVGIGLVALPTGIISSGFIAEFHKKRDDGTPPPRPQAGCPYCGGSPGPEGGALIFGDEGVAAVVGAAPGQPGAAEVLVYSRRHGPGPGGGAAPADLAEVTAAADRVARALEAGLGAEGVTLVQHRGAGAGPEGAHLHWRVIPRFADPGAGPGPEALGPEAYRRWAERIRSALA